MRFLAGCFGSSLLKPTTWENKHNNLIWNDNKDRGPGMKMVSGYFGSSLLKPTTWEDKNNKLIWHDNKNVRPGRRNRGIKTKMTIKTKLPLKFCMNSLTIIICQLWLD